LERLIIFFLRITEKQSFGDSYSNCNDGFDSSSTRMLNVAEIPKLFKTDFLVCDKVKGKHFSFFKRTNQSYLKYQAY